MAEYTELMNLKNTGGLEINSYNAGDSDEISRLNSKAKPVCNESASTNPQNEEYAERKRTYIRDALEKVLQNCQDRTRECYRSLFTAHCIDGSMDFEELIPLLDNEILKAYEKDEKVPNNYEIYLKYHPEVQKASAEAIASKMIKDFLIKLQAALKNR
jgi:hypothetical protein